MTFKLSLVPKIMPERWYHDRLVWLFNNRRSHAEVLAGVK